MSWQTYKAVFGDFFESHGAQGYAIIRHPLDILSSWWRYRQRPETLESSHPHHHRRTSNIAFPDWLQLWASRSDTPSTLFATQKETLQTPAGNPAPLRYFDLSDIHLFEREVSAKVGNNVTFEMLNVSPDLSLDIDEDFLLTLPRFREELSFFETLSYRAVK